MNRAEFQQLAMERIQDAKVLLAAKRWPAAYYVAGYAVECGLKACILALVERTGIIFEEKEYAAKCWTHDLAILLKLAGLEPALGIDMAANPELEDNWLVVKDWRESSRYQIARYDEAKKLYKAIADKTNGVLQWMKVRW